MINNVDIFQPKLGADPVHSYSASNEDEDAQIPLRVFAEGNFLVVEYYWPGLDNEITRTYFNSDGVIICEVDTDDSPWPKSK